MWEISEAKAPRRILRFVLTASIIKRVLRLTPTLALNEKGDSVDLTMKVSLRPAALDGEDLALIPVT